MAFPQAYPRRLIHQTLLCSLSVGRTARLVLLPATLAGGVADLSTGRNSIGRRRCYGIVEKPLRPSYVCQHCALCQERRVQQSSTNSKTFCEADAMNMTVMIDPHNDSTLTPEHRPSLLISKAPEPVHAHPSHGSSPLAFWMRMQMR